MGKIKVTIPRVNLSMQEWRALVDHFRHKENGTFHQQLEELGIDKIYSTSIQTLEKGWIYTVKGSKGKLSLSEGMLLDLVNRRR